MLFDAFSPVRGRERDLFREGDVDGGCASLDSTLYCRPSQFDNTAEDVVIVFFRLEDHSKKSYQTKCIFVDQTRTLSQ